MYKSKGNVTQIILCDYQQDPLKCILKRISLQFLHPHIVKENNLDKYAHKINSDLYSYDLKPQVTVNVNYRDVFLDYLFCSIKSWNQDK